MPKINVYQTKQPGVNVETGEVVAVVPRRVSVGWSRNQYAQIGVGHVFDPKYDARPPVPGSAGVQKNGAVLTSALTEDGAEWIEEWIDLDRHMINQLIRELRTARDQAFGKDE